MPSYRFWGEISEVQADIRKKKKEKSWKTKNEKRKTKKYTSCLRSVSWLRFEGCLFVAKKDDFCQLIMFKNDWIWRISKKPQPIYRRQSITYILEQWRKYKSL